MGIGKKQPAFDPSNDPRWAFANDPNNDPDRIDYKSFVGTGTRQEPRNFMVSGNLELL